jgi:hypothetical protein
MAQVAVRNQPRGINPWSVKTSSLYWKEAKQQRLFMHMRLKNSRRRSYASLISMKAY